MIREASVRIIFVSGSNVSGVLPSIILFSLSVSIYGTNTLFSGTSVNEDVVLGLILSLIARARIFAASARLMNASGRNVPSLYPLIHPFFTANVIYSAYQRFSGTSGNPESFHINVYRQERARTSILTNSARVIERYGSKLSSLRAIPDFLYSEYVCQITFSPSSSHRNIMIALMSSVKSPSGISFARILF